MSTDKMLDDSIAKNAIKLIAQVDSIYIDKCVNGSWQANATIGCIPGEWVYADTPAEAIVIACARAIDEYDPSPWCQYCGSMTEKDCDCGPIAENH